MPSASVHKIQRKNKIAYVVRMRFDERDPNTGWRKEGTFLACTFWLVECLARQGRDDAAREIFDRVASTSNDLGLFAEEYDTHNREMLGNFPQGLTHLSHIAAAVALEQERKYDVPITDTHVRRH